MAKTLRLFSAILCCLLLSACASPIKNNMMSSPQTEERVLTDVRTQYRNASLIVSGLCKGSHVDANGDTCYDLSVSEVYAGKAGIGDTIHCTYGSMNEGETYLLFLGQGDDVNHAEDTTGYKLLSDAPLPIKDSEVIWDGRRLPLNTLKQEISQLDSIISAPAPVYYYDTLLELADAADEIFIGRIDQFPEMTSQTFSIRNGGTVEKIQCNSSAVTIEAYGSIKGSLEYGQRITLIHCPERVSGMLDSSTLQHTQFTESQAPRLQKGGLYVFFLCSGPDSKQNNYFSINPIQGYIPLSGDTLFVCDANEPLKSFNKLSPLVQALQSAMDQYNGTPQSPALSVEK